MINATQKLDEKKLQYKAICLLINTPINIHFNEQKKDIKRRAAAQCQVVANQENDKIFQFKSFIQGISKAFNNKKAFTYVSMTSTLRAPNQLKINNLLIFPGTTSLFL